jgi:hypothetical protein
MQHNEQDGAKGAEAVSGQSTYNYGCYLPHTNCLCSLIHILCGPVRGDARRGDDAVAIVFDLSAPPFITISINKYKFLIGLRNSAELRHHNLLLLG